MFSQQVLTQTEWSAHASILFISIILLLVSRPLVTKIRGDDTVERRIKLLRSVVLLFMILQLLDIALFHGLPDYENNLFHLGNSIIIIYLSTVFYGVESAWSIKRFGKFKDIDGKRKYIVTYTSRMVDILTITLLCLIVLYTLINIWELDSLLHTTGIFGLFFAFLALTNAIWAPDIFHGLVILNCNQLEDGDTIQMTDSDTLYIISRVTFINTVLINVQKNHRTLVRNSHLTQGRLENLTKRASVDGLRFSIDYKIGYPNLVDTPIAERQTAIDAFHNNINHMFDAANTEFKQLKGSDLRADLGFEWYFREADDNAQVYRLSYYLTQLPATHSARKVRAHINNPRGLINNMIYRHATLKSIRLETPALIKYS